MSDKSEEIKIYQNIVGDSPSAVVVLEKKTKRILYANSAWQKLMNIPMEKEIIGKRLGEFIEEVDFLLKEDEIAQLPDDQYMEVRRKTSKGRFLRIQAKTVYWNGTEAYIDYITDETVIQNSRNQLQVLLNRIPTGVGIFQIEDGVPSLVYINDAYFEMIGAVRDNRVHFMGNQITKVVVEEDLEVIRGVVQALQNDKDFVDVHFRIIAGDGSRRWLRMVGAVVAKSAGNITMYACFSDFQQIMERQLEQKILVQRYQYELQAKEDLLNDAVIYYQLNMSKMEIEECRFMYGEEYKPETPNRITATEWMQQLKFCIAPQDQRVISKMFNITHMMDAYEKGNGELVVPVLHMNDKITDRWCSAEASLMKRPESGDMIAMLYFRDVDDEHKRDMTLSSIIEEEIEFVSLLRVDTKMARIIKSSPDCTLLPESNIYEFNDFGQNLIASHLKKDERQECIEYFDCDKMVKRLRESADSSYVFSCLLEDGKVHRKKTRAYYLDGSRKDIVIVRRDITELFEKEQAKAQELTAALSRAQEASKSKSAFLSRVSHDMRTPLNGILGLTRLMKDKTDWSEIQEDLAQLELSGDYLLNLINDTLDVSKIENGQLELHPIVCDGKTVFNNTMALLRPNMDAKNIEFIIHAKDLPFTMLYVDAGRLEQLVMNVLSNAIKFTSTGGKIEFTMENIEETPRELVDRVTIKDNGIGMDPEFLPHLFEPFSQEDTGRTSRYQGTGLGMTISKQIVELMGGEIQVKSEPGKGTEFTFTIHMMKATPRQIQKWNLGHKAQIDVKIIRNKRVLLCEDHPLNTQIAMRILEKQEMIVEHANNGAEGVQMYLDAPAGYYDLILMDIRMPVMDGLDATKKIRKANRRDSQSIPIIAMTANALSDDMEATQRVGMNAHLSKPIEPDLLYETIALFLANEGNR